MTNFCSKNCEKPDIGLLIIFKNNTDLKNYIIDNPFKLTVLAGLYRKKIMTCALNFCGTAGLAKTDKWQKLASILLFLRPVETKLAKDHKNTGFGHKILFSPELVDWIKAKFCYFSVFNQFCCVIKIWEFNLVTFLRKF